MTRGCVLGAILVAALTIPAYVRGHEGHPHKVMGAVAARHENHIEVKATDGKTATIALNKNTKILRGKKKSTADDIKQGERVVVTAMEKKDKDGRTGLVATEIRLPEVAAAK